MNIDNFFKNACLTFCGITKDFIVEGQGYTGAYYFAKKKKTTHPPPRLALDKVVKLLNSFIDHTFCPVIFKTTDVESINLNC